MAATNLEQSATIYSQHHHSPLQSSSQHRQINQNKLLLTSAHHHHHQSTLHQPASAPQLDSQMFQMAAAQHQHHNQQQHHQLNFPRHHHQANHQPVLAGAEHQVSLETALFQAHHPLVEATAAHTSSNNPLIDRFFSVASTAAQNHNCNQQQQQHNHQHHQHQFGSPVIGCCANGASLIEGPASTTADGLQQAESIQTIHHRLMRNVSPASRSTDSSNEAQFAIAQHHQNQLQHQYLAKEIAPLVIVVPTNSITI